MTIETEKKINGSKLKNVNIRIIFFDMDGTLYSSESILHGAYVDAIEQFNNGHPNGIKISPPDLQNILQWIGQPTKVIFANLFPQLSESDRNTLNSFSLQKLCTTIASGGGEIYTGVSQTLSSLQVKGYPMCIASNGRQRYLEAILNGFGLNHFFQPLMTIENAKIQCKADIIRHGLDNFSLPASQALMIGDRTSDIEAARDAGCWFAGVGWGHGPKEEIAKADFFLDNITDLETILPGTNVTNYP